MTPSLLVVTLNARLRPLDRGEIYEDPLDEFLQVTELGQVVGGGTRLGEGGEPRQADLEIELADDSDTAVRRILAVLEELGAPKGSQARRGDTEPVAFGATEGVGLYLNGTDLPDEVYRDSDVNVLLADLDEAIGDAGRMQSYWEGPKETAVYYYGLSGSLIRERMAPVLARTPLCQDCRLVDLT